MVHFPCGKDVNVEVNESAQIFMKVLGTLFAYLQDQFIYKERIWKLKLFVTSVYLQIEKETVLGRQCYNTASVLKRKSVQPTSFFLT